MLSNRIASTKLNYNRNGAHFQWLPNVGVSTLIFKVVPDSLDRDGRASNDMTFDVASKYAGAERPKMSRSFSGT